FQFRTTRDPYRILVCEILLRQTTAKQVDSLYQDMFAKYPNVSSLAQASEKELRKTIKSLGITKRAGELVKTARVIASQYHGRVPSDLISLRKLVGVGRYTAACVMTLGYGGRQPMVDSNARRVLHRIFERQVRYNLDEWRLYDLLAPKGSERDFHFALMDLASKLCRPSLPRCMECPLIGLCDHG